MLSCGDTNSIAIHSIHLLIFFFLETDFYSVSPCISYFLNPLNYQHSSNTVLSFLVLFDQFSFMVCTQGVYAQTQGSVPEGLHSLPEPTFCVFLLLLFPFWGPFSLFWERPCPASCRVGSSQVTSDETLQDSLFQLEFSCTSLLESTFIKRHFILMVLTSILGSFTR